MAYDQRDDTGSLFRAKERKSENSPDLTGQAKIAGVEYWVSAWTKHTKGGDKWLSLAFKEKDGKPAQGPKPHDDRATADKGGIDTIQEDIPF